MNPALLPLIQGLSTIVLKEWLSWVGRQQRPAGWKPSEADIAEFLASLDADTPEKIREEARQELQGGS